MNKIAPNITSLVGAYLAAKLLAHVGSLAKLAKLPASTIQLLGAEKALFRHMHLKRAHKKTRPPKYGIIFNHPAVQAARDELRGKVARLIASKLALAARTDFYVKKLKPEYKKELDEKLKEILGEK
jgi:nucleolar protein 56